MTPVRRPSPSERDKLTLDDTNDSVLCPGLKGLEGPATSYLSPAKGTGSKPSGPGVYGVSGDPLRPRESPESRESVLLLDHRGSPLVSTPLFVQLRLNLRIINER